MRHDTDKSPTKRRRLERRPYSHCDGLGEFLAGQLDGSDYRFCFMTFPVRQTAEDVAVDGVVPAWFENAIVDDFHGSFPLVHPEHGVLLLNTGQLFGDEEMSDLADKVAEEFHRLGRLVEELGEALAHDDAHWRDRSLPIGCAVIAGERGFDKAYLPEDIPREYVLTYEDLDDLFEHLEAIFDHQTGAADREAATDATRLYDAITEHPASIVLEEFRFVEDCQIKALQLDDARRAAEKRALNRQYLDGER